MQGTLLTSYHITVTISLYIFFVSLSDKRKPHTEGVVGEVEVVVLWLIC